MREIVCEATGGGGGGGGMLVGWRKLGSKALGIGGGGGGTSSAGMVEAWEKVFMVSSSSCVSGVGCEASKESCVLLFAEAEVRS